MNNFYRSAILALISVLLSFSSLSGQEQDTNKVAAERIENYQEQVKRLLSFFEFTLNTLGDHETTTKEKEIIINNSFLKAFRDEKVMIEDDLDENREVVTYKYIQAYLKDVDFFFKSVKFDIKTQEILPLFNEEGELYFLVTATRNLHGITVEGDSVNNDKLRYFELNLDEEEEVLKIASVYTTKLNEKAELLAWWKELPQVWKKILGSNQYVYDTITLNQIDTFTDSVLVIIHDTTRIIEIDTLLVYGTDTLRIQGTDTIASTVYDSIRLDSDLVFRALRKIMETRSLNISGNLNIRSLQPLRKLTALESLNISNTLIDDLFPLRNLIKLEVLSASGTAITNIDPLTYSTKLRNLDISATRVRSISPASNLGELESLNISNTLVDSIAAISGLSKLRDFRLENTPITQLLPLSELAELELLNCSGTNVENLEPLRFLIKLERIYIERTAVSDLASLDKLENLRILYADNSMIRDLNGLEGLPSLEYVYCDGTPVNATIAQKFMASNPGVLVVFESETLNKWWNNLEKEWRDIFSNYIDLSIPPSKEQLHEITLITKIELAGNTSIEDLAPLARLTSLSYLDIRNTRIMSLEPIKDLIDMEVLFTGNTQVRELAPLSDLLSLRELSVKGTGVGSIEPLEGLSNLRLVDLENTQVDDLSPLLTNKGIQKVYCDGTDITRQNVISFRESLPECLVIYQTPELRAWWGSLNDPWQQVFLEALGINEDPDREQMQRIANLTSINIDNRTDIDYLDALNQLIYLEELSLAGTQVGEIRPIGNNLSLRKLNISNNPVFEIAPIAGLKELTDLDLSNTPVDDLDPVSGLVKLQYLNISGTEVKKLDPLAYLRLLKVLECYNTPVKKLDPVMGASNLRLLKCYNTRISEKRVAEFKAANPQCEVIYY